jgi:head-tail adaptor
MTGAGDLREVMNFQRRGDGDDGFGNVLPGVGPWETIFQAPARVHILRGGEAVMNGRLAGTRTVAITIRWEPAADTMNAAWRAVDARRGTEYNISTVEPDEVYAFITFLAVAGVPT